MREKKEKKELKTISIGMGTLVYHGYPEDMPADLKAEHDKKDWKELKYIELPIRKS